MKRVVVTGMGAVTPIGITVEKFWESVLEGKVGIGPIQNFDTTQRKKTPTDWAFVVDPAWEVSWELNVNTIRC